MRSYSYDQDTKGKLWGWALGVALGGLPFIVSFILSYSRLDATRSLSLVLALAIFSVILIVGWRSTAKPKLLEDPVSTIKLSHESDPDDVGTTIDFDEQLLPSDPERIFERLHQFIERGQTGDARRLAAEAARRFPEHPRLQLAKRTLEEGKATANPWSQETASAESAWLDDPPEEARGRWVALIGGELVGIGDSAEEVIATVTSKQLEQLPVVQYIAA